MYIILVDYIHAYKVFSNNEKYTAVQRTWRFFASRKFAVFSRILSDFFNLE